MTPPSSSPSTTTVTTTATTTPATTAPTTTATTTAAAPTTASPPRSVEVAGVAITSPVAPAVPVGTSAPLIDALPYTGSSNLPLVILGLLLLMIGVAMVAVPARRRTAPTARGTGDEDG